VAALVVGLAYVLVSAYWGASGSGGAVVLLAIVVVLKVIAAILRLLAIRAVGSSPTRRVIRRLAWVEAGLWGVLVTVALLNSRTSIASRPAASPSNVHDSS